MLFEGQLITAIVLDIAFGDPRWFPHPVKIIGRFAGFVEQVTRRVVRNAYWAGCITALSVVVVTGGTAVSFIKLAGIFSDLLSSLVAVLLLYFSIAIRDLFSHSRDVYSCLKRENDISKARAAVSKIVGRDTETLKEGGVIKACIESVAENMVDGITAPLFWAMIAVFFAPGFSMNEIGWAAVGSMTYKSINTLDSMFGYRNDAYLQFGWASAKLDDLVNWPVARTSAVCLVLASFLIGLDGKRAYAIYKRDRDKHLSPNSAHPEAAVAGALGIRLGGSSVYHGQTVFKPTIGDLLRKVRPEDILTTNRIVMVASAIFLVFMVIIRQLILYSAG